jgi:hypothetical protein
LVWIRILIVAVFSNRQDPDPDSEKCLDPDPDEVGSETQTQTIKNIFKNAHLIDM